MRVLGFSVMWAKLQQPELTTFRLHRKDKDWQIGERVQVVFHPRSKDRKPLFFADIVNVESRSFDPAMAPAITNSEAIADGFMDVQDMQKWLTKSHGTLGSVVFNKLTLRKIVPPINAV